MKSLSILIPTMPKRAAVLSVLYQHLLSQIGSRAVEIVINPSMGRQVGNTYQQMSIGAKRQLMIEGAKTDYIVFVDDDDMVSHDYVERIYEAIQSEPDVVGMCGKISFDGQNTTNWCIRTKYDWKENEDGYRYVRYPNHLSPIKLEHALEAGFPDIRHAEDYEYSMRLKKLGRLQKEVFIDADMYHYYYVTKK